MSKYKILSKRYLTEAEKYLKNGNYLQASEKYWLSAAQIVKAYAEKRNISHDGHDKLFRIVKNLTFRRKDDELIYSFSLAGLLHTNAYENWLGKYEVKLLSKEVKRFIDKMNKII